MIIGLLVVRPGQAGVRTDDEVMDTVSLQDLLLCGNHRCLFIPASAGDDDSNRKAGEAYEQAYLDDRGRLVLFALPEFNNVFENIEPFL